MALPGPAVLLTAGRLCLHAAEARRLLAGGHAASPEPTPAGPRAYNDSLVRLVQRAVAFLRRAGLCGSGTGAAAVAAAYLLLRPYGWPSCLQIGPAEVRLLLWGEPVLTAPWDGVGGPRLATAGGEPLATPPRRSAPGRSTVARVEASGDLDEALGTLLDRVPGWREVLPQGASVLLKPNFNSAAPPPASTDLRLLSALVRQLRTRGLGRLAVGECCGNSSSPTRRVARRASLQAWARREGVELLLFDELPWERCVTGGRYFPSLLVPAALRELDRLVYLANAKTHVLSGASLGLKLGVGCLHPLQRRALHDQALPQRIAEMPLAVQPDLTLLDARLCFVSGGPDTGTLARPGLLLASRDLLALDEAGLELLAQAGATGLEAGWEQVRAARRLLVREEVSGD